MVLCGFICIKEGYQAIQNPPLLPAAAASADASLPYNSKQHNT